jgi:DNA-binding response OmpR family regulator
MESGYTVFTAINGFDCLSLLGRVRPNLIILDVMMPEMDGIETCRRIRRESGLHKIPILFVTAYPFAENVQKGVSVGGSDFIAKPFDFDVLLSRVASLMARVPRFDVPAARSACGSPTMRVPAAVMGRAAGPVFPMR